MERECKCCKGAGMIICPRCGGDGKLNGKETCYYCQGKGRVHCPPCQGKGTINE